MDLCTMTLPPKIQDKPEGRLDLIFLRPAIYPELRSSQSLSFTFTWWGDDEPHTAILNPGVHEVKIVFNVCCNLHNFLRYLNDARNLEVTVSVLSNQDSNLDSLSATSPRKKLHKSSKEWREGDIIGKFVVKDLKFSPRGECVEESEIYSSRQKLCGSIVTFMLYTADYNSIKESIAYDTKMDESLGSSMRLNDSSIKFTNHLSPMIRSARQRSLPKPKTSCSDFHQCDYLAFNEKHKSTPRKLSPKISESPRRSSPRRSSPRRSSPRRSSPRRSSYLKQNPDEYFSAMRSNVDTKEVVQSLNDSEFDQEGYSASDYDLLQKLFAFVDSGGIEMSALPIIYQICQGRTPSLDFSNLSKNDKISSLLTDSLSLPDKSFVNSHSKSKDFTLVDNSYGKNTHKIHALSSQSDKLVYRQQPSSKSVLINNRIYTSTSVSKASPSLKNKATRKVVSTLPEMINKQNKEDKTSNDLITCDANSAIILRINTINVNETTDVECSNRSPKRTKGMTVRQRSKIGYLLEVCVSSESCDPTCSNTYLFVSRQENNGIIQFDQKNILRLADDKKENILNGYLEFRLFRRKMGERLRNEIGFGYLSLSDLQEKNGKKTFLPLWNQQSSSTSYIDFSGKVSFVASLAWSLKEKESTQDFHDEVFINSTGEQDHDNNPALRSSSLSKSELSQSNSKECVRLVYNSMGDYWSQSPNSSFNDTQDLSEETMTNRAHAINIQNCLMSRSIGIQNLDDVVSDRERSDLRQLNKDHNTLVTNLNDSLVSERNSTDERCLSNKCCNSSRCPSKLPSRRQLSFSESSEDKENRIQSCLKNGRRRKNQVSPQVDQRDVEEDCQVLKNAAEGLFNCLVNLKISEGSDFPHLTDQMIAPNCYVRVLHPFESFQTEVIVGNTQPQWLYETQFVLKQEDLKETNGKLLLVVCHAVHESKAEADDPILGISSLDARVLWSSFITLSGWLPVLNRDSKRCGSLKVSLSPIYADEKLNQEQIMCQGTQTGISLYGDEKVPELNRKLLVNKNVVLQNLTIREANKCTKESFLNDSNKQPPTSFTLNNEEFWQPKNENQRTSPFKVVDSTTFIIKRRNQPGISDDDDFDSSDQVLVKEKSPNVNDGTNQRNSHSFATSGRMNSIIEHYAWRNNVNLGGTPCASYIGTAAANSDGLVKIKKKKKSRVAANFTIPLEL